MIVDLYLQFLQRETPAALHITLGAPEVRPGSPGTSKRVQHMRAASARAAGAVRTIRTYQNRAHRRQSRIAEHFERDFARQPGRATRRGAQHVPLSYAKWVRLSNMLVFSGWN